MTWRKSNSDCSVKILAMIASFRDLLDWMVSAIRSRKDLVLETCLSVGNCGLCTRNDLAVD